MSVVFDAYKAVDHRWRTARDIYCRVGCWSYTSVRHALARMADKDLIEAKSAPHSNGEVVEYRLKKKQTVVHNNP
jgi:hypothetical protein